MGQEHIKTIRSVIDLIPSWIIQGKSPNDRSDPDFEIKIDERMVLRFVNVEGWSYIVSLVIFDNDDKEMWWIIDDMDKSPYGDWYRNGHCMEWANGTIDDLFVMLDKAEISSLECKIYVAVANFLSTVIIECKTIINKIALIMEK